MKDNCKDCIHADVCNKKEKFKKLMEEVGTIKLNDGTNLLEAEDFKVIVNCKHYKQDLNVILKDTIKNTPITNL